MGNFTPGPWTVVPDRDFWNVIDATETDVIGSEGLYRGDGTDKANAALIAAAPDLYEALYELLYGADGREWIDTSMSSRDWHARHNAAKDKARSALAKANGA